MNESRMKTVKEEWEKAARQMDDAEAQQEFVVHGQCLGICDREIFIDCGNALGEIAMVRLIFRDKKMAEQVYCKRARLQIKIVDKPKEEVPTITHEKLMEMRRKMNL